MSKRADNPWARRRSRRAALQAVYAWQMTGTDFADLKAQFAATEQPKQEAASNAKNAPAQVTNHFAEHMKGADEEHFLDCLRGVLRDADTLDTLFTPYLDRTVGDLDPVERAILRIGAFELKERHDVPARVVINEWVELAKTFGAEQSFRYVNGVLHHVAKDLRSAEVKTVENPALPEGSPVVPERDPELSEEGTAVPPLPAGCRDESSDGRNP